MRNKANSFFLYDFFFKFLIINIISKSPKETVLASIYFKYSFPTEFEKVKIKSHFKFYYYGSTKDLFAEKRIILKKLEMSDYQKDIYKHFSNIEKLIEKKKFKGSKIFKSYGTS